MKYAELKSSFNYPANITTANLYLLFQDKKLALIESIIDFDVVICDVLTNKISIGTLEFDDSPDNLTLYLTPYRDVELKFDPKKFANLVSDFNMRDEVIISAKLENIVQNSIYNRVFYLDLISIQKKIHPPITPYIPNPNNQNCFIATVCYDDINAPEVIAFRNFRDNNLIDSFIGRAFIKLYYFISPSISRLIKKSTLLKTLIRKFILDYLVNKIIK